MQLSALGSVLDIVKSIGIGAKDFETVSAACQRLEVAQAKALLSTTALTDAERALILQSYELEGAELSEAVAATSSKNAHIGLAAVFNKVRDAAKGLWATLVANPILIVAAAFTALAVGVNMYKKHQEKLAAKRKEQIEQLKEVADKSKEEVENLKTLRDEYSQFADKTSYTAEEKERLKAIQDQLIDTYGSEAAGIDLVNGKYDEQIKKVDELVKKRQEEALSKANAARVAAQRDYNDNVDNALFTKKMEGVQVDKITDKVFGAWYDKLGDKLEWGNGLPFLDDALNSQEKVDALATAMKALREETTKSEKETEYYALMMARLFELQEHYTGEVEEYTKRFNDEAELTAQLFSTDGVDYYNVTSETYMKWRNALIDKYKKDDPELARFIEDYLDRTFTDADFAEQVENQRIREMTSDSDRIWYLQKKYAKNTETSNERITQSVDDVTKSYTEASDGYKEYASGISSIQDALSKQKNGLSISPETFNKEELLDYRAALEYTNGTMQYNAEKVREIAKAKAEEQIVTINTNKALAQEKYLENARKIEEYRKQLRNLKTPDSKLQDEIKSNISALLEENSALAQTCAGFDLLSSSIREAVGSYQNWLNAQNASDYGDMFNDALNAIERIRDTFDETSDIFGDFGSKKFDAAVDFIVPDTVDKEDADAIEKYMNDFKQYLTFDDNGNANGMNIDKFLENAVDKGLMVLDEKSGEFLIAGNKTMEDFAEGLNMSSGMVQAFFDELQLKGGEFDWSDEAIKTIGDLAIEANEAAEALRNLDGNSNLAIKMDVSDLQDTETQLAALDKTIAEMDTLKAKPGIDTTDIDNANTVIQYCLMQKQLLSQPDVMRVDTSQVEGDIGNVIAKLQEFQNAKNNLEILQKIGADTTDAESKVNSLTAEIQAISPEIKAKLSIDTTSTESISTSLEGLTAETINVKCGVDATAIEGYNPDSKTCDVIYNPDTDLLPQSFDSIDRTVNYVANTTNLPTYFSTITRYVKYVKTGDVSVNGTAHAGGTAYAGGNWGTAPGGQTLVGELGREIVVDPRTGQWYTVGDNGAEFRDIPAGAIVFNHLQSKSLLENGFVAGRAHALLSGTALVRGGIKVPKKNPSNNNNNNNGNGGNGNSNGGSNGGGNNNSSPSSNEKEEEPQIFDWIEVKIDRIERAINKIKVTAESTFKSLKTRLSATSKEMAKVSREIEIQEKAYKRYMKQADSVELSDELKEKVKNGTIDINEYDSETQELIKDYQEWYATNATIYSNVYLKFYLIAGTPVTVEKLQRSDEISASVNVENFLWWVISSEASNRGTFNDYPERE